MIAKKHMRLLLICIFVVVILIVGLLYIASNFYEDLQSGLSVLMLDMFAFESDSAFSVYKTHSSSETKLFALNHFLSWTDKYDIQDEFVLSDICLANYLIGKILESKGNYQIAEQYYMKSLDLIKRYNLFHSTQKRYGDIESIADLKRVFSIYEEEYILNDNEREK